MNEISLICYVMSLSSPGVPFHVPQVSWPHFWQEEDGQETEEDSGRKGKYRQESSYSN